MLTERLEQLRVSRKSSTQDYVNYVGLLAHTGYLDTIYNLFFKIDRQFISSSKEFNETPTYKHLSGLIEKIEQDKYPKIVRDVLHSAKNVNDSELQVGFYDFFKSLKPETANHEQNLVLNFLLSMVIKRNTLEPQQSIELVEYFFKAKQCNNYRKDFCTFSLIEYCQLHNNNSFFKLREKFYNHIQKIYYRIYESVLLNSEEQSVFLRQLSTQLKKVNDTKRDKVKPKVAVCISGLYRNHPKSLESIKENIVIPNDADVFIHSWDQKSTWLGFGGSAYFHRMFGKQPPEIAIKEIHDLRLLKNFLPNTFTVLEKPIYKDFDGEIFEEIFSPKKMVIESQEKFEKKIKGGGDYSALRGSFNQIKMFHGIKESIDLALEHGNYDYIIRLRPDVLINKKIELSTFENLNNNTIYATFDAVGLHDAEFTVSSSLAFGLSNLISEMFDVQKVSPYRQFPLYDSHNLLLLWLIENDYVFSKDLTSKRILTLADSSIQVPYLKQALKEDFQHLTPENQQKFKAFVEFLKENYCEK